MSAGKEFQTDGAATEKARRASSVRVRGTASTGASDERREAGRDITSRSRTASTYPRPTTRTKRYTSFVQHRLLHYQTE